jgi:hypothetical protein
VREASSLFAYSRGGLLMFRYCLIFCILFFFISPVFAADPKPPSNDELTLWVKQLGDDDFTTRTTAEERLRAAGQAAIPLLEGVSHSTDAEVHTRSNRLLGELRSVTIEKQLIALIESAKGFEAKIETSRAYGGVELKISGTVRAHPDGKRYACKCKYDQAGFNSTMNTISDGSTLWVEMEYEQANKKQITVQKCSMNRIERSRTASTPLMAYGVHAQPSHSLKTLPEVFRFTQMEEAKSDGVDVMVFSGSAREDAQATLNKHFAKIYGTESGISMAAQVSFVKTRRIVGKADGIVRKAEIMNNNGDVTSSMTLTDVKTVAQMEEGEFKYTPPASAVSTTDLDKVYKPED